MLWPLHVFGGVIWIALAAVAFFAPLPDKARKALTGIGHLFMLIVLASVVYALVGRGGLALGQGTRETVLLIKVASALGLIGVLFAGAGARRRGDADRAKLLSTVGIALVAVIAFCVVYLLG